MANQLSFAHLWKSLERRTDTLFLDAERDIDGRALKRMSLAVAAAVKARGWRTVGLHTEDCLGFVAGVAGIVVAGALPEVLPHTQPGFIAQLRGTVNGLVSDHPLPPNSGIPNIEVASSDDGELQCADFPWPDEPRISFRTSGSSGTPKPVTKSLRVVEAELTALESRFGLEMPDTFAGTVDHQHYYGATVRIFWPLLCARRIVRKLLRYPSEVMSLAQRPVAIVTSPTFLVATADLLKPEQLAATKSKVFSAGAPLPLETAERFNTGNDWLAAEIFGSTESGAICSRVSRRGDGGGDAWVPLPGVQLAMDRGCIVVDWRVPDDAEPVELSDRAEWMPDGRLRFLGRRDRIVKLREKRVNLAAVEAELLGHSFVREAAAVDLKRHRLTELGMVVTPTEAGFAALASRGHRSLADLLQDRLKETFDPSTLPRKWRFVRALPRNDMSKVTQESLIDLFIPFRDKPDAFPEVLSDSTDGLARTLDLRIGSQLRCFRGHFPGFPVLPGVVQIDWAAHFGAPLTKAAGHFERLRRVKFSRSLRPGVDVQLALRYDAERRSLGFSFSDRERTFSSGQLVYARR